MEKYGLIIKTDGSISNGQVRIFRNDPDYSAHLFFSNVTIKDIKSFCLGKHNCVTKTNEFQVHALNERELFSLLENLSDITTNFILVSSVPNIERTDYKIKLFIKNGISLEHMKRKIILRKELKEEYPQFNFFVM